jgi:chemotaxis protein methyltransferase CheR
LPEAIMDNSFFPMELREFELFRSLIYQYAGIWLRDGKQVMLASRLARRLRHYSLSSFAAYYDYLQCLPDNREEVCQLINCVTTNKTSFFRERHHFDYLAETILPKVQAAICRNEQSGIRMWSAACSTGEEPYSIAITLLEAMQKRQAVRTRNGARYGTERKELPNSASLQTSYSVEILASDIDTAVLNTAKQAIYSMDMLESIDRSWWKKYFLRGCGSLEGYAKVKPQVSRLVEFKRINLMDTRWPIEGLFDVIFFRNALIYFKRETQDIFLHRMARYLKPRGYLFLGNAEHIPWLHDVFVPLNRTMYQLRDM